MNVASLTSELVSIPSINPSSLADPTQSPGEAAIAEHILVLLYQLGATHLDKWDTYPGRPSVSGYFDFGAPSTLIFDTHLDTVPVDGMIIPPYGGEIRDGRVWGRGSADMKGPMAAMLCAIAQVIEARKSGAATPRHNVLFAATADEESGFGGVKSFVSRLESSHYPPLAGVIVAEPTSLRPVAAHKGTCRWIISVAGVAAHSSMPHLGKNAIYAMAPVISALEAYAASLGDRPAHVTLGNPTLSVGTIHGGSAVNIVPDHCHIQVDRRLVPGESLETATAELTRALASFDVTISEPMVAAPPMETPVDSPLVQQAIVAARSAGTDTTPDFANYCTNASFYPATGLPVIVFGPGNIAQAHTKDEWIEVAALEAGVTAYQNLIL